MHLKAGEVARELPDMQRRYRTGQWNAWGLLSNDKVACANKHRFSNVFLISISF